VHYNYRGALEGWPGNDGENQLYGDGQYDDFDVDWFVMIGSGLCLTIATQIFAASAEPLVAGLGVAPMIRKFSANSKYTQETLDEIYENPEWNLSMRMAQTMNVLFCAVMYASGMPILFWVGFAYCCVAYWADKTTLCWGAIKPPQYDQVVIQMGLRLIPVACLLHLLLSAWNFGHQDVFPSDWSFMKEFLADHIAPVFMPGYDHDEW
jgi:hypothetical protein